MVQSFIKITYCFIFIQSTLLYAQEDDIIDNISLNGKWAIIFDQDNRGGFEKWHLKHLFENQKERHSSSKSLGNHQKKTMKGWSLQEIILGTQIVE